MAASLRLPVLYVDKDAAPAATADTLNAMAINTTYVIGGPDVASTAVAVNNEVKGAACHQRRLRG